MSTSYFVSLDISVHTYPCALCSIFQFFMNLYFDYDKNELFKNIGTLYLKSKITKLTPSFFKGQQWYSIVFLRSSESEFWHFVIPKNKEIWKALHEEKNTSSSPDLSEIKVLPIFSVAIEDKGFLVFGRRKNSWRQERGSYLQNCFVLSGPLASASVHVHEICIRVFLCIFVSLCLS